MEKLVPNIKVCIDGTFLAIKKLLFADGAKLLLRKWGKHRSLGIIILQFNLFPKDGISQNTEKKLTSNICSFHIAIMKAN